MTYRNIYGDVIDTTEVPVSPVKGYAALPGTGPEGETCGTCKHHHRKQMSKIYHKCLLMKRRWTGGEGTDIRVKSPACALWEGRER